MCKSSFWLEQWSLALVAEKCVNPHDLWHMAHGRYNQGKSQINDMIVTNPSQEEAEIRELQLQTLINMFRIILSSLVSGRAGGGGEI